MSGLRTYYGREIGKEKASRSSGRGGNEVYNSKWPFFHLLHFLRDNITPRKTQCTIKCQSTIEIANESQPENESMQPNGIRQFDEGSKAGTSHDPYENAQSPVAPIYKVDNPPSSKLKRKRKLELEDELLASCLHELKQKPHQPTNSSDQLFAQYIGAQLKKIPEGYQKEVLKLEIQQLIVKAAHLTSPRPVLVDLDSNITLV